MKREELNREVEEKKIRWMESKKWQIIWVRLAGEKVGNIQRREGEDCESVLKGDGNKREEKREREKRKHRKGKEKKGTKKEDRRGAVASLFLFLTSCSQSVGQIPLLEHRQPHTLTPSLTQKPTTTHTHAHKDAHTHTHSFCQSCSHTHTPLFSHRNP